MSKVTEILDDILYGDRRPWLEVETSDEKYFSLKEEIKEMIPQIPLRFEIEFPRPSTNKTKYFYRLISNAVVEYSYRIISLIKEDDNENLVKYYLNDILNKHLKNRLRELGNLIKEKDFAPVYISRNYVPSSEDKNHQDNTYIIQFLKLAYMQIYLEVQEEFKTEIADILIPEDFYTQLLNEAVPENIPIRRRIIIEVDSIHTGNISVRPSENRGSAFSFTYKQFATNPEKINDLHDNLLKNKFIAADTSLTSFRKIFSGKKVTVPVKWLGLPSELSYLIKLLHNEHKLVQDLKQKQWKVVPLCFVDKDNNAETYFNIRKLQRPETKGYLLESAVKLLF